MNQPDPTPWIMALFFFSTTVIVSALWISERHLRLEDKTKLEGNTPNVELTMPVRDDPGWPVTYCPDCKSEFKHPDIREIDDDMTQLDYHCPVCHLKYARWPRCH